MQHLSSHWQIWLIEVAVFLALIFAINFILKRVLLRLKRRLHLKENDWRCHLDIPLLAPVRAFLWILFASFLIEEGALHLGFQEAIPDIVPLRSAGLIICMAWFLLRWKTVVQHKVAGRVSRDKPSLDPASLELLGKLFTIAVIFIALLILLQIFGLDIVPLVAFGGIGAAALGFASKDVIANFYGGFMIYMTRPFTVNEQIELPGKGIVGYIEEIGWYATAIRDLEKQPVYIPNAIFSTEMLINLSRITHRRIDEKICLRYIDVSKVERLVEQIRHLLMKDPNIDQSSPLHVYVLTFASSSIELEVKAYSLSTRYEEFMEMKQALLLKIYDLVKRAGADLAFPVTEVLLRSERPS